MIEVKGKQTMTRAVTDGYFVCLGREATGRIWAGSIGKGLMDCESQKYYTTTNGLANNSVYIFFSSKFLLISEENPYICISKYI